MPNVIKLLGDGRTAKCPPRIIIGEEVVTGSLEGNPSGLTIVVVSGHLQFFETII